MSWDIQSGAVFNIVIMLIVILIGIGIVTGFKTLSIEKIKALSETFEPGKVYVTNDGGAQSTIGLDCTEEIYRVQLNDIKFAIKKAPKHQDDTYSFITVLDYQNILFVGQTGDDVQEVKCTANDNVFICDDNTDIVFPLRNLGRPEGNQVFHFTTWEATPSIKNELAGSELTLSKLLENYPQNYISSFDATANIQKACDRSFCLKITEETECKTGNERGCYWETEWAVVNSCEFCPEFTNCREYSVEQCTQCPIPKAQCSVQGLPLFRSCEAV